MEVLRSKDARWWFWTGAINLGAAIIALLGDATVIAVIAGVLAVLSFAWAAFLHWEAPSP